jgi:hypothetical protein
MSANATAPTAPTAGLTPEARRAVTALIFGGITAILDTTIVTIALHTLVIKLHSTVGTIQWGQHRLPAGAGGRDPGDGLAR